MKKEIKSNAEEKMKEESPKHDEQKTAQTVNRIEPEEVLPKALSP
jgi:hypothetical protein